MNTRPARPEITDTMVYSTGADWHPALRWMAPWNGKQGVDNARKLHPPQLVDTLLKAIAATGSHDGAKACIRAAFYRYATTLVSPVHMDAVVSSYHRGYDDMSVPLQTYIDSVYSDGRGVHTFSHFELNEMGQKIAKVGEIWIDDTDIDGVWVFSPLGN